METKDSKLPSLNSTEFDKARQQNCIFAVIRSA